jgi:hypothetical protein
MSASPTPNPWQYSAPLHFCDEIDESPHLVDENEGQVCWVSKGRAVASIVLASIKFSTTNEIRVLQTLEVADKNRQEQSRSNECKKVLHKLTSDEGRRIACFACSAEVR